MLFSVRSLGLVYAGAITTIASKFAVLGIWKQNHAEKPLKIKIKKTVV